MVWQLFLNSIFNLLILNRQPKNAYFDVETEITNIHLQ
ncbi:hypothetical protein ymoll0001_32240 [Yersinia mollaretii ATCC 43969]|uniref:Uncharacterized protein n=1 Tax=Yersinia mollaretii (strain ATCC 43969 / DSM 18520 / CIP 103324 / CNY 7263 / WAIP 204) TaxID=349967 RepID=A0ABP2EBG9_YERMW|nr:hypothetical protein ymoll0001_32240 [Yersinia mollaretii ATCC 43969]